MLGRFKRHIDHGIETESVELKEFPPLPEEDRLLEDVIKDIIAMANTGKQGFILFGVADERNRKKGHEPVPGCNRVKPDDQVEREMNDKLRWYSDPPVQVRYSTHDWKGRTVGVLAVPRSGHRPHMVARNGTYCLRRGEYPVRRGTVADVLSPEEIRDLSRVEEKEGVILLNFSHPFTQEQIRELEERIGRFVEFVCPDGRIDEAAAVLLAELHGRMGHFPAIVRRKPSTETSVTVYAVAEVIDLAQVRDRARRHRGHVVNQ